MAKKKKLTEDQLVNEMLPTEQPVLATQSEITKATSDAEVAPNAVSAPFDPLKPPLPGMIPTGWANPEDLAASLALETGDVVAAQTAEDATVVPPPEPVEEEPQEAEEPEMVEDDDVEIIESVTRGNNMRRERTGRKAMPTVKPQRRPLHEADEEMDVDSILADTDTDEVLDDVVEPDADPEDMDIDALLATIPDALDDLVTGVENEVDQFKAEVGMEDDEDEAEDVAEDEEAPQVTEDDINAAAAEFDAEVALEEKRKARVRAIQESRRRRMGSPVRESRRPSARPVARRVSESRPSAELAMRERARRVARVQARNRVLDERNERVHRQERYMEDRRPSRPATRRPVSPLEERAIRERRARLHEMRVSERPSTRRVSEPRRMEATEARKAPRKSTPARKPVARPVESRKPVARPTAETRRPARPSRPSSEMRRPAPATRPSRPVSRPASRPVGAIEERARQNRERMILEARKQKQMKSRKMNEGIKYPKGSEPQAEQKKPENLVESYAKRAEAKRANVNALSSKLSEKANPRFTEALKSAPVKMNETVDSKSWQANTFEEHYKESQKLNFEDLFKSGNLG